MSYYLSQYTFYCQFLLWWYLEKNRSLIITWLQLPLKSRPLPQMVMIIERIPLAVASAYEGIGGLCCSMRCTIVGFFTRSISDSMIIVYSDCNGGVTSLSHRQSISRVPTMTMQIGAIREFVFTFWYFVSNSILPISIRFVGNFILIAAIIWRSISSKKYYKHGWKVSLNTLYLK